MTVTLANTRTSTLCVTGSLVGLLLISVSLASGPRGEGTRTFSIVPQFTGVDEAGKTFTVLISMRGGDYPEGSVAVGRIDLGPNLAWVKGDSAHTAHPSSLWTGPKDNLWTITLRAVAPGRSEVRASMRAEVGGGRIDEMESCLEIFVAADGIRAGSVRAIREETIREGQRYRHAGRFLVPIDGPEEVTTSEIRVRAAAVLKVPATFAGVPPKGIEVRFIAFIDPKGELHSFRVLPSSTGEDAPNPEIVSAATQALRRWKFSPARAGSKDVADWVNVRVQVHQ